MRVEITPGKYITFSQRTPTDKMSDAIDNHITNDFPYPLPGLLERFRSFFSLINTDEQIAIVSYGAGYDEGYHQAVTDVRNQLENEND